MSRVQIEYQKTANPASFICSMEGNIYFNGVGRCRIVSCGDNISFSFISSLVNPRNVRHILDIEPGYSYKVVRPTATLTITNPASK